MDKVQIFTAVLCVVKGAALVSELVQGKAKSGLEILFGFTFDLPIVGRIFGWW